MASSWWRNRNVLVTGQTGFKGAWLCLWLEQLGANVSAFALPPATNPNLYELSDPWTGQKHNVVDIRDRQAVQDAVQKAEPEIIFHMAAQALVRHSYKDPVDTYATNVMGSIHMLEAIRQTPNVKTAIMVTTDKVYENAERGIPFREDDRLGGIDPYSNSKACMELAVQSYRDCFFQDDDSPVIATVRAGNVVGGGDWAEDRLIPDIVRAYEANEKLTIRNPASVRPWQHVLDPLNGYMMLAERLTTNPDGLPSAFNFGPNPDAFLTVAEIVDVFSQSLDRDLMKENTEDTGPHEAKMLTLDTALAKKTLGWAPRLNVNDTIAWTAEWYKDWSQGSDPKQLVHDQIARYETLSAKENAA